MLMPHRFARAVLPLALLLAGAAPLAAQTPALSAADYARAERDTSWGVAPLVWLPSVRPNWLPDGRFWYRNQRDSVTELVLVDPARGTRAPAFAAPRMRAALAAASGLQGDSLNLAFSSMALSGDGRSGAVEAGGRRWRCDAAQYRCALDSGAAAAAPRNSVLSPDGRRAAFIRDYNLWVRELADGRETQLTRDGVKDFGYATDNAGWVRRDTPVLLWSPDSRSIATFQQDERNVGEMYLVQTGVGHPRLEAWKYPLVGDSVIQMLHRVVIHLDSAAPRVVRLQLPPDPHRSTLCDHVVCGGQWADVEWSADSRQLAFVSSSRDHRQARLRLADPQTGAVREVLEETVPTFFESGSGRVNWHLLSRGGEVLWFSERDDWGNLYLYDLASGRLKRQVTHGPGNVLQVLRVDEQARILYFTAVGREPGRDPYLRHLYRVSLDGGDPVLLTPEDADHDVTLSPDGRWFVDSYSRVDVPPVVVLRSTGGGAARELERGDISRLLATGWTPPLPVTLKARDGRTDLYGLLYRPAGFDSTRSYPIINHVYPGPQTGSVGSRGFSASRDARSLAELGFVVVEIDALGTPLRNKAFHAAYFGDMGDNGLPDQVAGMRELARRFRWIDLSRAGIYGHSGGGYAAADAMFRYPDFFSVGISEAGNHDNRNYEDDWGEKWQGLLRRNADGTTSYDDQANQNHVAGLRGHLLLAHGTADNNVPPDNTLLVVDALIRANKDFDLLMLPNRRHGFGNEPYMVRRRWDYFVQHLMGATPPREYAWQLLPAATR
jgi:dipeptidyl aminopeptidase/acylaminoacyl peptidase